MAVPPSSRRVTDRAFTAGSVLVAGTIAVTGVFIAKTSQSYAQAHSTQIAPTGSGSAAQSLMPGSRRTCYASFFARETSCSTAPTTHCPRRTSAPMITSGY